jgi:hypothetical protein
MSEENPNPQPSKKLDELTQEEKVKFTSGKIIGFNPFKLSESLPAQYTLKDYTNGGKIEFRFEHIFKSDIAMNGVEEGHFSASHLTLNPDL